DDGRGAPRGPPGLDRARRLPEDVRDDGRDVDGGRDPSRRRPDRPSRRGGLDPGRPGAAVGPPRLARAPSVRAVSRGRSSAVAPWRADARRHPPAGSAGGLPLIAPAEPIPTYDEPAGFDPLGDGPNGGRFAEPDLEPALPDEARNRAAHASQAPTSQIESQPD